MTGAELRTLRLSLGLSQMALAQLLEVWPATVAKWETRDAERDLPRVTELAIRAVLDNKKER